MKRNILLLSFSMFYFLSIFRPQSTSSIPTFPNLDSIIVAGYEEKDENIKSEEIVSNVSVELTSSTSQICETSQLGEVINTCVDESKQINQYVTPVASTTNVSVDTPIAQLYSSQNTEYSTDTYTLTAYCSCYKCCGKYALNRSVDQDGKQIVLTASGNRATVNKTIAVDTTLIPFGTNVEINGIVYEAQDTGSAVKGKIIDIYFDNHDDAKSFGKQKLEVKIYK